MAKMRVYELAKELGIESADVLSAAADLGFETKSASSGLDDEQVGKIKEKLGGKSSKKAKAPKEEKPAKEEKAAKEEKTVKEEKPAKAEKPAKEAKPEKAPAAEESPQSPLLQIRMRSLPRKRKSVSL